MRCKDYLSSPTFTTLTIANSLKLSDLQLKSGYNIFTKSVLSPTNPILIKMGSIPVLQFKTSTAYFSFTSVIDPSPDYSFITANNFIILNTELKNITKLIFPNTNYWNMLIKFEYNSSVFALTSYNKTFKYQSLGTFALRVASSYGTNNLISSRSLISVQSIQTYPFSQLSVNRFKLNCDLNGLILNCFIQLNISNYGQSNQLITFVFNDGLSQDIEVNPYCK